jgi:hypothetical protein
VSESILRVIACSKKNVAQHGVGVDVCGIGRERGLQVLLRGRAEFALGDFLVEEVCPADVCLNVGLSRTGDADECGVKHRENLIELRSCQRSCAFVIARQAHDVEAVEQEHGCIYQAIGGFAVLRIGLESRLIGVEGGFVFAALHLVLSNGDVCGGLAALLMMALKPTQAAE